MHPASRAASTIDSLPPARNRRIELGRERKTILSQQISMDAQPHLASYAGEHLGFEQLIAELSKRFIDLDSTQVHSEIEAAQKLVCETLGFDRSTLAQWDEGAKSFIVTHSWASSGIESSCEFKSRNTPWFASKILRGEEVRFTRDSDLPFQATKDKETIGFLGPKSSVIIPLKAGGKVFGGLAFGNFRHVCEWPEEFVYRLRLIASVFSNALALKRSAEALLEIQEKEKLAAEMAGLGSWSWNLSRQEVWASEKVYSLIGHQQSNPLTCESFLAAVHPEDLAKVQGSIGTAALIPMEFSFDFRVVHPDGSVRWMNCRGRSSVDTNGKTSRISGFILDITDRKLSNDRFRLAVEASPTAMVMVDVEGTIVLVNEQVERIFGCPREELIGQSVDILVPHRFLETHPAHPVRSISQSIFRATMDGQDFCGLRKDGSEFRAEVGLSPIHSEESIFDLISITDITDRIRATEAIQNREQLFRTVANTAPVLIWMSGRDKLCTFFNDTWLRFTGRRLEEELGQMRSSAIHPDDLNHCLEVYSPAFDARLEFEMEYRLRRSDGEYRWVFEHGVPIFEPDGTLRGYVGSCIDITERKDSQKALIDANKRLVEASLQIDNFKGKLKNENVYLQEEIKVERNHQEIVGQSQAIKRVLMKAEQVAPTNSTVLLLGETGTGKELIARAIHRYSKRGDRLMVKVNCAALPATLVENELFGREKGAYTGALTREIGRFELAHDSTIFLDEIGELPLELQVKLLRVLQEGEFERLGSSRTIRVDARLIVATSRNLETAVREGKFREDLYYRLNVFPIHIPPLRERREDIPMLTWHFLRDLGGRMGREIESVRASTMNSFVRYSWPGNVRELRNVIERHLITYNGPAFEAELPPMIRPIASADDTAVEVERNHIQRVLERTGWRIRGHGGAAETLDLKPTTLESRMRRLGIFRQ
jgi:formate hydrogenlyase transcriptional activator